VLEIARKVNMGIEYVETNSSWYRDSDSARALLEELKASGLSTLLVSISPFHNEYISFGKVKGVMAACRAAGVSVFPWIRDFYDEINGLDDAKPHALSEYQKKYGEDYLESIPSRYWIHLGGRALNTYREVFQTSTLETILAGNDRGCAELADVSHFHLDCFGNYIPGLCSGLAIRRDDLGRMLMPDDYPVLTMLYHSGITEFYDYACREYGFEPDRHYLSKCHLCFDIRRHLVVVEGAQTGELQPHGIYIHA
jgi:hypothetical protein